MFILTAFKESAGLVRVFDTSDDSNDIVNIHSLAEAIRNRRMKVYGIGRLSDKSKLPPDAMVYDPLGIYISPLTARKALYEEYIRRGYNEMTARKMAGLQ